MMVACAVLSHPSVMAVDEGLRYEATHVSILGEWNLIDANGQPSTRLTFEGSRSGGTLTVSTNDGCNGFTWFTVVLENGTLSVTGSPAQTLKGCPNTTQELTVIDLIKASPLKATRVDSDLILATETTQQRFRLRTPAWPRLATPDDSLAGTWRVSSIGPDPVIQLIAIPPTDPADIIDPCAVWTLPQTSVDSLGLLTIVGFPSLPENCTVDPRVLKIFGSRPQLLVNGMVAYLQTTTSRLTWSRIAEKGKGIPRFPMPTPPPLTPRLSNPATAESVLGSWRLVSIDGNPTPAQRAAVVFTVRQGGVRFALFDGCNTVRPTATASFNRDGSMNLPKLSITKAACSEVGFSWDLRIRSMLANRPIVEHVGSNLVVRNGAHWFELARTA
jgi:heat shock protein HslJ